MVGYEHQDQHSKMSIVNNYRGNQFDMRLSKANYWDVVLSSDVCVHPGNCSSTAMTSFDFNDPVCISGNTIYSLSAWTGAINTGVTLNDIGLTGVDNGLVSGFTGSTLVIPSGDTRFFLTQVGGTGYTYPISIQNDISGDYIQFCGGFYQGFFKLSDRDLFTGEVEDNLFVLYDPCKCPFPPTGTTSADTAYNYQVLPTRVARSWTVDMWVNPNSTGCTGTTGTTLNDVYPDNKGIFFYIGTRAENKFWNLFSGETGSTTTSGIPLSPTGRTITTYAKNPFLIYGAECPITGITTTTVYDEPYQYDIINNALAFRIKDDGSIGYRLLTFTGTCSGNTYVSGITIEEQYSLSGMVPSNQWSMVSVKFVADYCYSEDELKCKPIRPGKLYFYVNGKLKLIVKNFKEFVARELLTHREKQQGVPFNMSIGGGSQGLIETQTVGGPDSNDLNKPIQENFAGSFIGGISAFNFYGCHLGADELQKKFSEQKSRYGY